MREQEFCVKCGRPLHEEDAFCAKCGQPRRGPIQPESGFSPAPVSKPKRTGLAWKIPVSIVLGFILLTYLGQLMDRSKMKTSLETSSGQAPLTSDKCGPCDPGAATVADTLLNEWKHGQSGSDLWEPSVQDVPAFNVARWERLDIVHPAGVEAATLTGPMKSTGVANTDPDSFQWANSSHWSYRITNAKGATRTWNVWVVQSVDDACKVYDITEAK